MEATIPQPDFTWQAHPARERPGPAAAAAAAVVLLSGGAWLVGQSPWWAGAAALVLFLALNRFFLPSRFEIDAEGITARYPLRTRRARWADLRRFAHDRYGGYLSTRSRPSRMDAYGGLHLVFGADRDDAVERIETRMQRGGDA